jgi:hypothetical protein
MMSADPEHDVPEGAAVFPVIPAELGIDPLLLAVLHAVVFLDGSEAAVVNPAAADEALDRLAFYLQRLSGARLQRIREDLEVLASFAKAGNWPKQKVRFLNSFLADFGVVTEEA